MLPCNDRLFVCVLAMPILLHLHVEEFALHASKALDETILESHASVETMLESNDLDCRKKRCPPTPNLQHARIHIGSRPFVTLLRFAMKAVSRNIPENMDCSSTA